MLLVGVSATIAKAQTTLPTTKEFVEIQGESRPVVRFEPPSKPEGSELQLEPAGKGNPAEIVAAPAVTPSLHPTVASKIGFTLGAELNIPSDSPREAPKYSVVKELPAPSPAPRRQPLASEEDVAEADATVMQLFPAAADETHANAVPITPPPVTESPVAAAEASVADDRAGRLVGLPPVVSRTAEVATSANENQATQMQIFAQPDLAPPSRPLPPVYRDLNEKQVTPQLPDSSAGTPVDRVAQLVNMVPPPSSQNGLEAVDLPVPEPLSDSGEGRMRSVLERPVAPKTREAPAKQPAGSGLAEAGIADKVQQRYSPTWLAEIRFPMLRYTKQSELSLVEAIHTAIQFAPEIEVFRTQVGISRAEVIRQQANFDWNSFVEANWDEFNVPVGSNLDGANNRLERHTLAGTYGLERFNQFGGQLRLAQDLGLADSNSVFFNPPNQATARWALEYQQPLLQGAGLLVNKSIIDIAIANARVSEEELVAGLQEHVLEVAQAYWDLVTRRGEYVIQKRSYDRALRTATVIANRTKLDVGPVQSARAEATLNRRRTAVIDAEYQVVFAQERLLRLIFGARFKESVDTEIVPISDMLGPTRAVDMLAELQVAFKNRAEIRRALQLIKRSAIEQGVARNQLLPLLGLSLSLSNQGLKGNRGLASALGDQFDLGDPTYGVGLSYALPIGNRAAKANLRQAQLQVRRLQKEFETVVAEVALEVRNASHLITLNGRQRTATESALTSAARELTILEKRAELLVDGDEVGPLYLDNLLQTQDRLATAELGYLGASSSYALAHFELQRATGGLLRCAPLPVEAAPTNTWSHRASYGVPMGSPAEPNSPEFTGGRSLAEPKFNAGR